MEIAFNGQRDQATFIRAFMLISRPALRSAAWRIGGAVIVLAIYIGLFITGLTDQERTTFDILRAARHTITAPFVLYFFLMPYIRPYFTARKLWKDRLTQIPLAGMLTSQGVSYHIGQDKSYDIPWGRFVKKRRTDDLLVLLTADSVTCILPRDNFSTEADWKLANQWVDLYVIEAK